MRPRLETRGTPSEPSFQVAIAQWLDEHGSPIPDARRQGACLVARGTHVLMPQGVWALVNAVRDLATNGSAWTSDERLRRAGQIRTLAHACGGVLDRYLEQTRVVLVDSLPLELKRAEALGIPVLEVTPRPTEAPDGFVDQFDRYGSVRGRYDVTDGQGGVAHVLPGDAAREALSGLKARPGRRFAGAEAEAFLRNPRAVLGEEAGAAIDEEDFARARRDAGIQLVQARVESARDGGDFVVRFVDADGVAPDRLRAVTDRGEVESLRDAARRSRQSGRPLYAWDGEDIECGADTDELIREAERWLKSAAIADLAVRYAEVFDLTAYSDRVVGFDGRPIAVPYVARKDASQGWIPENVEYGLVPVGQGAAATARPAALTTDQISALAESVRAARERGAETVAVPGLDQAVPVAEAQAWVDTFRQDAEQRKPGRAPKSERDPESDEGRPVLRILHNIEELDYQRPATGKGGGQLVKAALPDGLRPETRLLEHQDQGVAWMQTKLATRRLGLTGCLLADDMGLGKTLQALCLIARYLEHEPAARPCLVVAPVSLLENWKAEIERFFASFPGRVVTLYGETLAQHRVSRSAVDADLQELGLKKFLTPGFERGAGLVLTTYETLRDYEFSLARVSWGIVVCDEAQKIKTPRALVTRAAKALKSDFKIACTGTPVENSLADLWCLFDFVQPGLLGSLNEFTRLFRRSIETREPGHEPLVQKLRESIDPWVLRRLKTEVATLPPKHEGEDPAADPACLTLSMSPLQQKLYAVAVGDYRAAVKDPKRRQGTQILELLHRLRMVCSNPTAIAFDEPARLSVDEHVEHSPKLRWMLARLSAVRDRGEKAIVFTEFRDVQLLVQRVVRERFGVLAHVVNGSTSVDPKQEMSRQRLIDQFQAAPGFGVIVLSTTAVGFGVNVQGANHVIHFTRPWNPAKEDQATDRAYRIGQKRPVHVYCPTINGDGFESFDQRVAALLSDKRALSRDMLAGVQEISLTEFESL
jgi:hypothetical protein